MVSPESEKREACSWRVNKSARIWVGCHNEERAFRTGTGEYSASSCVIRLAWGVERRPGALDSPLSHCGPQLEQKYPGTFHL